MYVMLSVGRVWADLLEQAGSLRSYTVGGQALDVAKQDQVLRAGQLRPA